MKKHKYDKQREIEGIVAALNRIAGKLKKTPTQKEYKRLRAKDEPTLDQIVYRLGSFSEACRIAVLKPNPFQTPPRQPIITQKQLMENLIEVSNNHGGLPSTTVFPSLSKYSVRPYKKYWGSLKNALSYMVANYRSSLTFKINESKANTRNSRKRILLGKVYPLLYEPINEYETIALFVLMADKLGYKIKHIQSDFPDAVLIKNQVEILAEFEYMSSKYLLHGHPLDFNGICICWRKDVSLNTIPIISLEDIIKEKN